MITDWLDPVSYKLGQAAGGGGGSGNPNYVETITGTLANPWGEKSYSELVDGIVNLDASVTLIVDATSIGYDEYLLSVARGEAIMAGQLPLMSCGYSDGDWSAVYAFFTSNGTLYQAMALSNGQTLDMTQYAALLPTTLEIVHHPLP